MLDHPSSDSSLMVTPSPNFSEETNQRSRKIPHFTDSSSAINMAKMSRVTSKLRTDLIMIKKPPSDSNDSSSSNGGYFED